MQSSKLSPLIALLEAERSFYVSGNRVHFTRGQEHVSIDITKTGPRDVASKVVAMIVLTNAMADLQRTLKREPSYEELAEAADDEAHAFAQQVARAALHMGASDFRKAAEDLFPGLAKEAPKLREALAEGFHVPENELKLGRHVRWYDDKNDQLMHGHIIDVSATSIKVNDGKFATDKIHTVTPDKIIRVSEEPKRGGKERKVVWNRG